MYKRQNSNSLYVARRLVVVLYQMAGFGSESNDNEYAAKNALRCYQVLDQCIQGGMEVDPWMAQLYEQLKGMFDG